MCKNLFNHKDALDHLMKLGDQVSNYWKVSFSLTIVAFGWYFLLTIKQPLFSTELKLLVSILYTPVIMMSLKVIIDTYEKLDKYVDYFRDVYLEDEINSKLMTYLKSEIATNYKSRVWQTIGIHMLYFLMFMYLVWCY